MLPPVAAGCGGWMRGCAGIFKPDFECFMKDMKYRLAAAIAKHLKFRNRARCWKCQVAGLLLLSLWTACKEGELPPPSINDPVFMVGFSTDLLNNQSVTAGQDEVYLFTSYFTEGQEIFSAGTFAKEDCPDGNCPGSLKFEFRHSGLDSAFLLGSYNFIGSDPPSTLIYLTTFSALPNSGFNSFFWKINDVNAGQGATLVREFLNDSARTVELTARKTTGLVSRVQRTISLVNPDSLYPSVGIFIQPAGNNDFLLTAEASSLFGLEYLWSVFDSAQQSIYEIDLSSSYGVTVTDDLNNTASAQFDTLTPSDVPVRSAGFNYTVQPVLSPVFPGNVRIEWVDPQGGIWRSDWDSQPTDAFFQVLESEPYEKNENNQETQKMRVTFSCRLFSATGDGRNFSGSGVIAVARP